MEIKYKMPGNWSPRKYLIILVSCQLAFIGSFTWSQMAADGYSAAIREFVALSYLLFVPGNMIVRLILRSRLGAFEEALFSVGLSVSFLMFLAFAIDLILPTIGEMKPISENSLMASIMATNCVLLGLIFLREKNEGSLVSESNCLRISTNAVLFLISVIALSVTGALIITEMGNNLLALVVLLLICVAPIFITYFKTPGSLFPLSLYVLALALLFQKSFVSEHLTGWDVHVEYYYSHAVVVNGFWSPGIPSNTGSILSTCMFAPAFSIVSDIPLVSMFKIVYPIMFAIVPLCVYHLFRQYFNPTIAYLSVLLMMFTFVFTQVMIDLPRQEIGELFMGLLMVLMLGKGTLNHQRRGLALAFAASIIVSHYALSYLMIFLLLIAWVIARTRTRNSNKKVPVSKWFIGFYAVLVIIWYAIVGRSSVFDSVVRLGSTITARISSDFLTRESSQVVYLATTISNPMHEVTKYLHLVVQLLVVLGIFAHFLTKRHLEKAVMFESFALACFVLLVAGEVLPYFASSMNFMRIYQIALLGIAPFFFIGVRHLVRLTKRRNAEADAAKIGAFFLVFFLLFNSGFVYELTGEPAYISVDAKMDFPRFHDSEVVAAEWLSGERSDGYSLYADEYRWLLLFSLGMNVSTPSGTNTSSLGRTDLPFPPQADSYIFLGWENTQHERIVLTNYSVPTSPILVSVDLRNSTVFGVIEESSLIYSDGYAETYYYLI